MIRIGGIVGGSSCQSCLFSIPLCGSSSPSELSFRRTYATPQTRVNRRLPTLYFKLWPLRVADAIGN
jgi:hypothetical protein